MPSFGASSMAQLNTLDPLLQAVLRRSICVMDFTIVKGHRGEESQNAAFAAGNSKLKFPDSLHNPYPAKAVDVAPYPIDWEDVESFCLLAGVVKSSAWQIGVGIRWGGDWNSDNRTRDERFRDYGHFELVEGIWLP